MGEELAEHLVRRKAIMGVFDEGCMGMFNAIVPDHLLHPRVSSRNGSVNRHYITKRHRSPPDEAEAVRDWIEKRGMRFHTGPHEATDLTDRQIRLQCQMYVAALRLADDFGCDLIGIQYQQGLKDLLPASDLVEGMLNSTERPPVLSRDGSRELYRGTPADPLQRSRRVCGTGCAAHPARPRKTWVADRDDTA